MLFQSPNNPIVGKMWYDTDDPNSQSVSITKYLIETTTGSLIINGSTQCVILASASVSPIYITLPATSNNNNAVFNIKKIDSSTRPIYVNTSDSSSIDGANPVTIINQYNSLTVVCDGSNYFIL